MTRATVNNPLSTPGPVILIVDDDAELRGLLSMVFKRAAYTLLEAATGDAALVACQTQQPDLILLDMMMPQMSGVTACEKIRALPGYAYVPILMVTALQDTASITQAFEAGATDYVTKPLNPVVLRHRVDQLLRATRAEAQLRDNELKFRSFIEQASDGFVLVEADGSIIEWNQAMEQITGLARAEAMGRSVVDVQRQLSLDPAVLTPTRFQEYVTAMLQRPDDGSQPLVPFSHEWAIKQADTVQRVIHAVAFPILTGDGYRLGSVFRDVTERLQIEAALRDSEERYRLIADNMTDSIWLVDLNLKIQYVSPSAARQRGYSLEEIKQLPFDRQMTPASFERAMTRFSEVLTPDRLEQPVAIVDTIEIELYRKDGSTYWEEDTITLVRDIGGQPVGLVGVGRDITARKRVEAALRHSEERHRLITENMSDAVWLMDMQMRTVYVSPAVERSLGYTFEEIRQFDSRQGLLTPHSLDLIRQFFADQLTPDKLSRLDYNFSQSLELEYIRRDGATQWSEVKLTLIRDADGQATGILSVGRDITERKRAEAEVLQLNADLTQRARELDALNAAGRALTASLDVQQVLYTVVHEIQTLLDSEQSAVMLHDVQQHDLVFAAVAGEGSERLVGTSVPAGVGIAGWVMQEGQPALVHDTTHDARFWDQIDALTGYSTRSVVAVPIEFRGVRLGVAEAVNQRSGAFTQRDQDLLTTLASSAAIAIENARLYQVEREQLQRLQESQARLVHAEKMSALGRLVASLTHEINNPLQAVQSGLYVMAEGLLDQLSRDELIEDVRLIEHEVKRIANLMQRLREFSRPVRLESRPTDLHALLDNLLELMNKQFQIQKVAVNKHWDSQLPVLIVNADLLTQVFMNLLINAIDAMPTGGALMISSLLDRAAEPPHVRIEVADTGSGIEAEVLKHIFEPFVTTKPNGVGLGLAISYEIIQSLGGEILASSQPGDGTTFTVRLPLPALK